METGRYVGGATRLGIASTRPHVRALAASIEAVCVALSGLAGGLFFFRKDAALAIGGFPESHLIAEDMTFAKALRAHGTRQGLKFLCLRSVTILTMDRKHSSVPEMLWALGSGLKAFLGFQVSKEVLDFWYKPRR
jgi:hypothetical protein